MGPLDERARVVDAVCGWGWDHAESAATSASATACVAAIAPARLRDDFLLACITGEVDAVEAALARDPALATAAQAPRGWPPLLYVCYSMLARTGGPRAARVVEVAARLLAGGADPGCAYTGADGATFPALYAAIAVSDNLALAARLLEAGADPNDRQSLYHAAERFETDVLDLLYAHDLDPGDVSYCLLHKLDFQHQAGIRWFLDHGADPDARHPAAQETALHWAIKRASPIEVIELLLERGADPDARTAGGVTAYPEIRAWTPLDLARRLGRADLVALLRARGAAETPPDGDDALVLACVSGDDRDVTPAQLARLSAIDHALLAHIAQQDLDEVALRMIARGWPTDVRGWMDATPLHWAACRGNARLARGLLAHGAAQLDVGGYFRTPMHTARHCRWSRGAADHDGVIEALIAAGATRP